MEFHGSDKKCNFFGTLLCTNVNIILNKNNFYWKNQGKLSWQRHGISKNDLTCRQTFKQIKRNFGLTCKCKAALGKDQFHKNLNI